MKQAKKERWQNCPCLQFLNLSDNAFFHTRINLVIVHETYR
jgi:hypothetical protein